MNDLTRRFRVNEPQVVHDNLDGEVILIHMDTGNYYSIDQVGAEIWDLLSTRRTVQQVVEELLLRYEGDSQEISKSVAEFIRQLEKEELIVADDASDSRFSETESPANESLPQTRPAFSAPTLEIFSDMQDLLLLDPIHEVDEKGWPHEVKE